MTENTKSDRGLLLAIGGVVVAGAAGIAIVAGMQSGGETMETPKPRIEAMPATRVQPTPAPTRTATPTPTPMPQPEEPTPQPSPKAVEPVFQIDPNADFADEGQKAYARREFDQAVAYFQAATDAKPKHGWSHYMLGLSQWKSGDLVASVESLERSAECNPGAIKTWINLSRVQNERGEFDAALTAAQKAKQLDPLNATALFVEGRSLYNLGRIDDAETVLAESRMYDADNGYAANLLGLIQLQQGRELAAVVTLSEAVQAAPDAAFIHNNLGTALERAGQESEALVAFQAALDRDPSHAKAAISLARVQARLGTEVLRPVDPQGETGEAVAEADADSKEPASNESGEAGSGSS